MGQKNKHYPLKAKMQMAALIGEHIEPAGGDRIRYTGGFDDQKMAKRVSDELGEEVTHFVVKRLRQEVHGHLEPVRPARPSASAEELANLRLVMSSQRRLIDNLDERLKRLEAASVDRNVEAAAFLRAKCGTHVRHVSTIRTEMRSKGYTDGEIEGAMHICRAVIRGTGPEATIEVPGPKPVRA